MKHIMFLAITMIIFSCDPPAYHDYSIKNDCDQNIFVNIVDHKNSKSSITIKPFSKGLIYNGETINRVCEDEITYFFKSIDISKDGVKTVLNPMDYKLWQYEEHSKRSAISTLVIKPSNF